MSVVELNACSQETRQHRSQAAHLQYLNDWLPNYDVVLITRLQLPSVTNSIIWLLVEDDLVIGSTFFSRIPAILPYLNRYKIFDLHRAKFDVHRAVNLNIISIVKPTRCTSVSNLFYFGMTLYIFRTVFPSIIRSSRLYIQQQASVWILNFEKWINEKQDWTLWLSHGTCSYICMWINAVALLH